MFLLKNKELSVNYHGNIMQTRLCNMVVIFTAVKIDNFQFKIFDFFLIFVKT